LHEEKIAANVMTCSNYPLVLFFDFSYLDAWCVLFINKVSSSIYVLPGCHNKSWTSHLSLDLNNYSFSQIHRSPRKEGHKRGKIHEVIYMPLYLHYFNLIF
jgi:hypothetical protein